MFNLLSEFGSVLTFNMVQFVIGCVVSVLIYSFVSGRPKKTGTGLLQGLIPIAASALAGMILPIGAYGLLFPIAALLASGICGYMAMPMLISNAIFNMLVPFTDVSFVWRNGINRIIMAFLAGFLVGLVLWLFRHKTEGLFRRDMINGIFSKPVRVSGVAGFITENISRVGVYMVAGVIADTLFRKYLYFNIIESIFINPKTSFIPRLLSGYDIANPYFLLSKFTIIMLMDFIRLSAIAVILKPKGILSYYVYYIALATVLSVSMFT